MIKRVSFLFFFVIIFNCSSKKNILYLQDSDFSSTTEFIYSDYKIKIDDILKIDIISKDPALTIEFNRLGDKLSMSTKDEMLFSGYLVDSNGDIYLPSLGKFHVQGMSTLSLRNKIIEKIIENKILKDPFVDVKILNQNFTILGEVNSPGRYEFIQNNFNVIEAIGMAGDLTINGVRDNIKIIREVNDEKKIFTLDLTDSAFLQDQNVFQIISGDIIIVNPNVTRVKNAGIIGNSGTLLSLLSFLLSIIIVTSR